MRRNEINTMPCKTRLRRQVHIEESNLQLINCHSCKTVECERKMVTCPKPFCRESFCFNCVKQHYIKFSSNSFIALKARAGMDKWRCYKCKKMCTCVSCVREFEKSDQKLLKHKRRRIKQKRRKIKSTVERNKKKRKRKRKSFDKKMKKKDSEDQIHLAMHINEEEIKNVVTIDKFKIYECFDDADQENSKTDPKDNLINFNCIQTQLQSQPLSLEASSFIKRIPLDSAEIMHDAEIENNEYYSNPTPIIQKEHDAFGDSEAIHPKRDITLNNLDRSSNTDSNLSLPINLAKCFNKRANKPCILCDKTIFPQGINLIKFSSFEEFLTYMKNRFDLNYTDIQTNSENYNTNFFSQNKLMFEKLYESYEKIVQQIETRLKGNKRFCTKCIENLLQKDKGLIVLFDNLKDEDEQANLDENKKLEILKNMRQLIGMHEEKSDRSNFKTKISGFAGDNNIVNKSSNSTELNIQGSDNIFDMIFKNSNLSTSSNKIEVNYSYNPNIYFDFKNIEIFNDSNYPRTQPGISANPNPVTNIPDDKMRYSNQDSHKEEQCRALLEKIVSSNYSNSAYTMMASLFAQKEMMNFLGQSQNNIINNLFSKLDSFIDQNSSIFHFSDCHITRLDDMISKLKLDDASIVGALNDVQELRNLKDSNANSIEILSMIISEMKEMNKIMKNIPSLLCNNLKFFGGKIKEKEKEN